MTMAAKLGKKTRPMANAFMNFYNEKFKPVLQNISAQRDRSTQTANDVINLTGNTNEERTGSRTHESDPGVVQEEGDVMLPPQENVDNCSSLFDYGLNNSYNDFIDDFDPYLEYGERYQNRMAFEDAFYR